MTDHRDSSLQEIEGVLADYLLRIEAGEQIDRTLLLRQFPDLADELQAFFSNDDRLRQLAGPPNDAGGVANPIPLDMPTLDSSPKHQTIPAEMPTFDSAISARNPAPSPTGGNNVRYFGDYELLAEIARGGMGVVYKARQVNLKRVVALKMILAGQLASEQDVKRFYQEAEAAANLNHPGIVPIYEIGQHGGQHFFSMAFVEGDSLSKRVADGPMPPREAAELLRKVAVAVDYAHQRGVVHRDLKPANVLLDAQGEPIVTDFGLAKNTAGDRDLTTSGQILGTPGYMPPEQAAGAAEKIGPPADIYSLGAILYCLLTGRPPFLAANVLDTLMQVLEKEPLPPREVNPAIPRDLETICLKCLQKDRHRRYTSAQDLADDLGRWLRGEPILARPVGQMERGVKWVRRHPAVAVLSLAVLASLVAGTVVSTGFAIEAYRRAAAEAIARRDATTARNLAIQREQEAQGQRQIADREAERAREQEHLARQQEHLARQRFYAAQINLAQQAWEAEDPRRVMYLLESQRPDAGEKDLRTFEWYYLWRLCHQNLRWMAPAGTQYSHIHQDGQNLLAISPDGKTLAVGSFSGVVTLRDVATGKLIQTLRGFREGGQRLAFSPDGATLAQAAGPTGKEATLWSLQDGQRKILHGTGYCRWVIFTLDGAKFATGGKDGVKLWDTTTWRETVALKPSEPDVRALAVSPQGDRLAVKWWGESSMEVEIWDLTHVPPQRVRKLPWATNIAFSLDGATLVGKDLKGSGRRRVVMYDVESGKEKAHYQADLIDDASLAISPTGAVAFGTSHGRLVVWQPANGQMRILPHGGVIGAVAFTPDGQTLASLDGSQVVKVWNVTADPEPLSLPPRSLSATGAPLAISPDCKMVAVVAGLGDVELCDAATGKVARTLKGKGELTWGLAFCFSADGTWFAAAYGNWDRGKPTPGEVVVWETATGREAARLEHATQPWACAFSPDGKTLATGSSYGVLSLWDVPTFQLRTSVKHQGTLRALAFAPDGKTLAGGSWFEVGLYDPDTGNAKKFVPEATSSVRSLAWSPDGSLLAVGVEEGIIRLRDASTTKVKFELQGHTTIAVSLAFFPDGQTLASGSEDGSVKLWDATIGQERLTMLNVGKYVAVSPDGRTLITGGEPDDQFSRNERVKFWRAATKEEAIAVSALVPEAAQVLNYAVQGSHSSDAAVPVAAPLTSQYYEQSREAAAWVLQVGGSVRIAADHFGRTLATGDSLPAEPFRVTEIHLKDRAEVADADLARLQNLTALEKLDLLGTGLTDEGMKHLRKLTNLRWLDISRTKVKGEGLAQLAEMTKLNHLATAWLPLTNGGLSHLPALPGLTTWAVTLRSPVTDDALAQVQRLPALQRLGVWNSSVTGEGLQHVSRLPDLRFLAIQSSRLENQHLAHLKTIPSLRELSMPVVPNLSAEGLGHIAEVEKLEQLNLARTNLTDDGLKVLAQLKNLKVVDVSETQVTAAGIAAFKETLPQCEVRWGKATP